MIIRPKPFLVCLAVPLITGVLAALVTGGSMGIYQILNKPPLSPPGWLFSVVWTLLYILMGIASYLVYISDAPAEKKNTALKVYALQLVVNFLWPIWFFSLNMYLFSFVWLVLLWVLVVLTALLFYRINKTAGYLMIPYLLWVSFAGYLNLSVYLMN